MQSHVETPPPRARPRIGLALGGGAARGWAHIGVLRAMMRAGIVPDVVAGTSIGALVGGCWAADKLDELARWSTALTRRRVFGLLDFNLGGAGLIGGARLSASLEAELGKVMIEQMRVRYAAVATEIATAHEIWLTRGRLVEAICASYALPGIFEPVRVGGRWLMDGTLVNPVPVSVARALGARVVIAVNLHSDVFGRGTVIQSHGSDEVPDEQRPATQEPAEPRTGFSLFGAERLVKRQLVGDASERPGLSTVMVEAINITQDRIARARLASDPPDVTIGPKLGHIGLFEFHRAEEAIRIGEQAAEKALENVIETIDAFS